jgi:hypothetical protein
MKRPAIVSLLGLAALAALSAQAKDAPVSPWSFSASPAIAVPLFSDDGSGTPLYSVAWGGGLTAEYALGSTFPLALRLGVGYSQGGFKPNGAFPVPGSISEVLLLGGASSGMDLGPRLFLRGFVDAGLALGSLSTGTNAPYAAVQAGAGLGFKFNPSLQARLELAGLYKAGLYGGIGAKLGLGYALPAWAQAARPRLLELLSISMKSVFPVLRSYYDQHPIGSVKIANTGKETATDVRVSFVVRQYMDAPKECATIARLEPGNSIEVPLYALFNDRILDITEATKVTGEVSVEYGVDIAQSRSATVLVNDRNALTWSDDRKAAAFVSSRDPWVLELAGNFMATVKGARNPEMAKNLQTAIAVHEGLRAYGIGYMLSTTRPFEQAVLNPEAVDTLKFPRQTLTFRAGDCADLSVLYASCLEAAGVETAFITIPGHILMAIDLGLTGDQVKARSMDARELISQGGRIWLPIETTMRDAGFLEVWKKGAQEWRDASARELAAFYPMHEAWQTYAPMGLPADGTSVALPASDKVGSAFRTELARAVSSELGARISALGPLPASGPAATTALNTRGVIYGRFGRLDEALQDFKAAAKAGSVPALVNLGNVSMMRSDPTSAYDYYQQAARQVPGSASLYLNIAKAAAALGKSEVEASALDSARRLDPLAAEKYSELAQVGASGTRAAEVGDGGLQWF